MRTTIYDIAKRANVSGVTVSRVLNNANVPIAPETRKRILELAKELNYTTNRMAKALVTGKTNTLALIVHSIDEMLDTHYTQLLEIVHRTVQECGYLLITSENIESVAGSGQVDGIIWLANPKTMSIENPGNKIKLIYVWPTELSSCNTPNLIAWDDASGMYNATKYLLDLGHKNIVAIWGDLERESLSTYPKARGYRSAMETADLDICELVGRSSTDQCENGYIQMTNFLDSGKRPSAVIARNDLLALGAMKALKQKGLCIPSDVSVIGYNDTIVARCADPALTSIRTPLTEAGSIAVDNLLKMVNGEIDSFDLVSLETSLTIRETCAPPHE